jgi:hypothetical protein
MAKKNTDPNSIIIFFDIDGVLGDFDSHARARGKMKPDGKVDYEALEQEWWASMPVYDGARALVQAARKLGAVRFLTGPIPSPTCYGGKAEWVKNFQPEKGRFGLMDLIICPASDKGLMAGPRRILIDDRIENVEGWRAAGGIGIHHTGDFTQTFAKVAQAVRGLKPSMHGPSLG